MTQSNSDQIPNANRQYGFQQPYYGTGATGQAPKYGTAAGQAPMYGMGQVAGASQVPTYGTQLPYSPPMQAVPAFPPAGAVPGFTGAFQAPSAGPQVPGMLPLEQSYIENILRLNKGKLATVYTNFDNGGEGLARSFSGIIEAAGRDHLILSDPQTGMRYLIPMVYFAYATFDEELEYDYPFAAGVPGLSAYAPR